METNLDSLFSGKFFTDPQVMAQKLEKVKAFIFDWDGVFNNGEKSADSSSNFSEVDSMGSNLLRYSHFLKKGEMPLTAVISGEKNATAFYFCKREGFHYSFFKVANKINALSYICEKENIKPEEVAYFFDDVLDLSIAEVCGVRIMVDQKANPMFVNYCVKNKLVDYLTSGSGGQHAVREGAELLISLNANYDEVVTNRKDFSSNYLSYLELRKKTITRYFSGENNEIKETSLT